MKKPTRVAAIIETTEGILMVQDAKDKFREQTLAKIEAKRKEAEGNRQFKVTKRMEYAKMIVQDGRFSLPGGKIEACDYEEAGATSIIGLEELETPDQIELYREVVRETIIREISEELALGVDEATIKHIAEIQGRSRDHIICLVRAEGVIKINRTELSGIGLLTQRPAIPLNEMFYQHHVREVYHRYVKGDDSRPNYALRYLSKINVNLELIAGWFRDVTAGYAYASLRPKQKERMPSAPTLPHSSPNFLIYNEKGEIVNEIKPPSLTNASNARIVPPDPQRPRAETGRRRKSDPAMKAVKEDSLGDGVPATVSISRNEIPANGDLVESVSIPSSSSRPTGGEADNGTENDSDLTASRTNKASR